MAIINDNGIDRQMTATELAAYQQAQKELQKDFEAWAAAADAKAAALASARAKLAALGLSEAEVAAIVGG